jgi:CelD/BcsL family acetyltransferase involved in cellulose biosynthesis
MLSGLDEVGRDAWNELWTRSDSPSVFASHEWATAWWNSRAEGRQLRIYTAHDGGRLIGLVPTAWPVGGAASGPVVLVGDEHADYAALLTECGRPDAFQALLEAICADLPRGGQLLLRDVRSDSVHARLLAGAAEGRLTRWRLDGQMPSPRSTLDSERLAAIVNKDSLRRHARKLARLGKVDVSHLTLAEDILPRLDAFFDQHVARWAPTGSPSLFLKEHNRALYRRLVREFSGSGRLVFTEVALDGAPVASHFGFVSEADLIWYKPAFDLRLASVSPGEVLIRELFLYAAALGLTGVDFTRFCNQERATLTFVRYQRRADAIAARGARAGKEFAKAVLPAPIADRLRAWARPDRA